MIEEYLKKLNALVARFNEGDIKELLTQTVALITVLVTLKTNTETELAEARRDLVSKEMVIKSMTSEISLKNEELDFLRRKIK